MASALIPIAGTFNFRDLGGIPLASGGVTQTGVLFRSDALSGLTPKGMRDFAGTPVGTIIDFRTETERETAPNRLPDSRAFDELEMSILAGSMTDMAKSLFSGAPTAPDALAKLVESVPGLDELYIGMLQGGAAPFVEVARRIARSAIAAADETDARADAPQPTAVLVHCTAGKDRTGIASALMLAAVGAERDAIVDDYATSQRNLAGEWADGRLGLVTSLGIPLTPTVRDLVTGSPPDAMHRALGWLEEQYGDAAAYLASGGLTGAELAAVRGRLAG